MAACACCTYTDCVPHAELHPALRSQPSPGFLAPPVHTRPLACPPSPLTPSCSLDVQGRGRGPPSSAPARGCHASAPGRLLSRGGAGRRVRHPAPGWPGRGRGCGRPAAGRRAAGRPRPSPAAEGRRGKREAEGLGRGRGRPAGSAARRAAAGQAPGRGSGDCRARGRCRRRRRAVRHQARGQAPPALQRGCCRQDAKGPALRRRHSFSLAAAGGAVQRGRPDRGRGEGGRRVFV